MYVLDPKDGRCKLDGTSTNVGTPCLSMSVGGTGGECGGDSDAFCLDSPSDPWPGGYCTVLHCSPNDGQLCPLKSSCVRVNGQAAQCFLDCASNADCARGSDGGSDYFCLDLTGDSHWVSGGSHKVCMRLAVTCPGGMPDCPASLPHCGPPEGGAPSGGSAAQVCGK
jgi:hypothetical protein